MTRRARTRDSEAAFQTQIVNLAKTYQWMVYFTYDSRRSPPGFPDLILVRDGEIVFAELKTESGRVRPDQKVWIAALSVVAGACASVDVYLWRPSDFDRINNRLARGRVKAQPLYRPAAA